MEVCGFKHVVPKLAWLLTFEEEEAYGSISLALPYFRHLRTSSLHGHIPYGLQHSAVSDSVLKVASCRRAGEGKKKKKRKLRASGQLIGGAGTMKTGIASGGLYLG